MKARVLLCFLLFLSLLTKAQYPAKPNPMQYVNDFAKVFTEEERVNLHRKLLDAHRNSNSAFQIIIVTVPNMKGMDIKVYSQGLAQSWGVGKKDLDNGIVMLMAKAERKVRIELGYGMEASITDANAADIIDNIIIPAFKQGQFYRGFDEGANRLIEILGAPIPQPAPEPETPVEYSSDEGKMSDDTKVAIGFFAFFVILLILIFIFSPKETRGNNSRTYNNNGNIGSYSDYSDYSDSRSSYSDYSDRSSYSDYSDSSSGGGSFGGGGADGSW